MTFAFDPSRGSRRPSFSISGAEDGKQISPLLVAMSLLLHAVIFAIFFFFQILSPPLMVPPVVRVDLVALETGDASTDFPEDSPAVLPEEQVETPSSEMPVPEDPVAAVETPATPVVPIPETAAPAVVPPVPEPEVPVKIPLVEKKAPPRKKPVSPPRVEKKPPPEVPRKKSALKKKTYKKENVLAHARRQAAASVKKQKTAKKKETDRLDTALSRMRKKVADQQSLGKSRVAGTTSGQGSGGDKNVRAIDLYNLELMYRIQQNWAFNSQLAGGKDNIEVRILIKILKSGQIRDIWFETRSGNRFLDESALKAVRKSTPLSPLPRGYDSYDVGLIFTPSGLL